MIVKLTGRATEHGLGFLIVECQGVGYKVIMPEDAAHGLSGEVVLYTHEVIREDGRELFGFRSMEALQLFWKLIAISGVGPRVGQKITFAAPVEEVKARIMEGSLSFLTDIPGIGTKTAQKIILELKGVLAEEPAASPEERDVIEALETLGYPRREIEKILGSIEPGTTEARIRAALKLLSGSR